MSPSPDPQPLRPPTVLSPGLAVFLGHLFVTLPGMILIYGCSLFGQAYMPDTVWVSLLVGFFGAWGWYSFSISRWRRWALARVDQPAHLQNLAELTGLLWPKGSVFEKREFKEGQDNKKGK